MTSNTLLDAVRQLVGRRYKITRKEMREIIIAIGLAPEASTITGRPYPDDDRLVVGNRWIDPVRLDDDDLPPSLRPIDAAATNALFQAEVANGWVRTCRDITIVSLWPALQDHPGCIRYDQPGTLAPDHHCTLMFVPAECTEREGTLDYLRRHATRVLVVKGAAHTQERTQSLAERIGADGVLVRILPDHTLELRDPNDGQDSDPAHKRRHQYRISEDGRRECRVLPPESVGDAWRDIGIPEWEAFYERPQGVITTYFDALE